MYHCSPGIFSYVSHSVAPVFDFGNSIASNRCRELPSSSAFFCYDHDLQSLTQSEGGKREHVFFRVDQKAGSEFSNLISVATIS